MPMSLRSPSIRHVPLIGLGHFPLGILSKDTAPMGMGLPSQGIEKNRLLNQDAIAMFASVAACERRLLEPYHCTKALPSPYHFDNWVLLCDVYFQLSVPALELPRSDLPANVRFCGALEGHNAAAGTGTNMTTTTALLPPWFNDFVRPSSPTDSRPLILVTSGTLPGQSAHDLILPTISACATLPVRLVVCAVHVPFDPDYALPPMSAGRNGSPSKRSCPTLPSSSRAAATAALPRRSRTVCRLSARVLRRRSRTRACWPRRRARESI
jgi:UDP:flavonoid glycosyltransferase YjiC (YdhE family)